MWNILIGAVFIVGGLSGTMVMRGTESGIALAALGGAILLFGIYQMSTESKEDAKMAPRPRKGRKPGVASKTRTLTKTRPSSQAGRTRVARTQRSPKDTAGRTRRTAIRKSRSRS